MEPLKKTPPPDSIIPSGHRDNTIQSVVVFSENALVTRSVNARVEKGIQKLRVEITAFSIDRESPQAQIYGALEILGIQYMETPVVRAKQPGLKDLEAQKKELQNKKSLMMKQLETLEKQKSFLDSFIEFSKAQIPKEIQTRFPSAADVTLMVDTLGKGYTELFNDERQVIGEIDRVNEEITLVERKIKAISQPVVNKRKIIEVLLESEESRQIQCKISYIANHAKWAPLYKADIPAGLSDLNLTMFAVVSQKTGEDWEGTRLAVSNAVPMEGADISHASPWYVDTQVYPQYMPSPVMAAGSLEEPVAASAEPYADGAVDIENTFLEEAPAQFQEATEKKLPLAFEYEFSREIALASGEDESFLPVYSKNIPGDFYYHAVPALENMANLVCCTQPDQTLLACPLNIHFAGRYVGTTQLPEHEAGQDLLINLGPDRGVTVRKKKTHDKISETFFGKVDRNTIARELSFAIIVENVKDEPVRVTIEDAAPVSKTDRILIKGLSFSPKPDITDVDDKKGVMQWSISLTPGQIKTIKIDFGIRYPKEFIPYGL